MRVTSLIIYRALDVLALCLVWLFVPGTVKKIATMEDMNHVFSLATRQHVRYQVKEVAPWCISHYILRRSDKELRSLYLWQQEIDAQRDTRNTAEETGSEKAEEMSHTNGATKEK